MSGPQRQAPTPANLHDRLIAQADSANGNRELNHIDHMNIEDMVSGYREIYEGGTEGRTLGSLKTQFEDSIPLKASAGGEGPTLSYDQYRGLMRTTRQSIDILHQEQNSMNVTVARGRIETGREMATGQEMRATNGGSPVGARATDYSGTPAYIEMRDTLTVRADQMNGDRDLTSRDRSDINAIASAYGEVIDSGIDGRSLGSLKRQFENSLNSVAAMSSEPSTLGHDGFRALARIAREGIDQAHVGHNSTGLRGEYNAAVMAPPPPPEILPPVPPQAQITHPAPTRVMGPEI